MLSREHFLSAIYTVHVFPNTNVTVPYPYFESDLQKHILSGRLRVPRELGNLMQGDRSRLPGGNILNPCYATAESAGKVPMCEKIVDECHSLQQC